MSNKCLISPPATARSATAMAGSSFLYPLSFQLVLTYLQPMKVRAVVKTEETQRFVRSTILMSNYGD